VGYDPKEGKMKVIAKRLSGELLIQKEAKRGFIFDTNTPSKKIQIEDIESIIARGYWETENNMQVPRDIKL